MSLITNSNGDVFIQSDKCFSNRDKLAPQEQYITNDEFYRKIKDKNILSKYIRIIDKNNKRVNNPNRNKGIGYKQFVEMCHIIGIIGFAWNIDNLDYMQNIINEFHTQETIKLNSLDLSIKSIENDTIYFQHISNIGYAENTKKLIDYIKDLWGSDKIINTSVTSQDLNLLSSLQEFLRSSNLWRIDSLNRYDVGGTYSPNLKSSFYFGTKIINPNLVNMIDLGKYNYKLEIENEKINWNSKLNDKYKNFEYFDIPKLIESNIDPDDVRDFIIFTYDKSIYNKIDALDIYARRFEMEFLIQIPYEIKIHGYKFKLIGMISNSGSDGGHDIAFFKIPNSKFWQYVDEYYAFRVYEDNNLNYFNNNNFNHINVLADLATTANTFLLEKTVN